MPDTNTAGRPRGINDDRAAGRRQVRRRRSRPRPGAGTFDAFGFGRFLPSGQTRPGLRQRRPDGSWNPTVGRSARTWTWRRTGRSSSPETGIEAVAALRSGGAPPHRRRQLPTRPSRPPLRSDSPIFKVPGSENSEAHAVRVLGRRLGDHRGFSEVGAWLAKLDDEGQPVSGFGNAGFAIEDLGEEAGPLRGDQRHRGPARRPDRRHRLRLPGDGHQVAADRRPLHRGRRPRPELRQPAASSPSTPPAATTKARRSRSFPTARSWSPGSMALRHLAPAADRRTASSTPTFGSGGQTVASASTGRHRRRPGGAARRAAGDRRGGRSPGPA